MPKKFWIGLIIILVIYTLFYLFFKDTTCVSLIPRKLRHVWHLNLDQINWMKTLWHLIHLSGIAFLVLLGAYDWLIRPMPMFMRELMDAVNEFLIGPTLFVGMALLQKFLLKHKKLPKN